ncbi:hypothetical protein SLEP1_g35448 [Rubroshorea leprosula]|uniref:Reverse transcriptase Ty1/copia-type domain-containing protein n=1 Tax=Rubroshorea leprosula TaxID=152421 RepID=A0AAV5KN92_9ROSI|nr:hypothetical protein SLEP1_g35448 [Rubroshorea leprosula]
MPLNISVLNFNPFSKNMLHDASSHAAPGSTKDALPTRNALDNVESSSLISSISPVRSNPIDIELENEIINPPSSHPTQIDVKNVFLNGDLVEEVYMKPPPRLEHPPNKSLPSIWFETNHGMVLLLLYVDDMIITRDDILGIHDLRQFLNHKFEMKDLGVLSYFLGLEVTSYDDGYLLSQTKYAYDLISKAGFTDSKTSSTPLEPNV